MLGVDRLLVTLAHIQARKDSWKQIKIIMSSCLECEPTLLLFSIAYKPKRNK